MRDIAYISPSDSVINIFTGGAKLNECSVSFMQIVPVFFNNKYPCADCFDPMFSPKSAVLYDVIR